MCKITILEKTCVTCSYNCVIKLQTSCVMTPIFPARLGFRKLISDNPLYLQISKHVEWLHVDVEQLKVISCTSHYLIRMDDSITYKCIQCSISLWLFVLHDLKYAQTFSSQKMGGIDQT